MKWILFIKIAWEGTAWYNPQRCYALTMPSKMACETKLRHYRAKLESIPSELQCIKTPPKAEMCVNGEIKTFK